MKSSFKWKKGAALLRLKPAPFTDIDAPIHPRRGFTLIEVLVVMILIAIASSLVLMHVGQSGRMRQNRMFAGKMVDLCRKARLTAVGSGIPTCMTISPEARECRINRLDQLWDMVSSREKEPEEGIDWSGLSKSSAPKRDVLQIPEVVLLEGERIQATDNGISYICFYPDGSSSGGALTVSVEDEFEYDFQVDMLTGAIREVVPED